MIIVICHFYLLDFVIIFVYILCITNEKEEILVNSRSWFYWQFAF